MADEKIPTNKLLQRLFRTANIKNFIKRYTEHMKREPFSVYVSHLCEKRNTVPDRVIKNAGIERTYGHKFFNGTRKPTRDKVIQLAFGFKMDVNEAQKLLEVAQKSLLHPKVPRDAVILHALKNSYGLNDVQMTLQELGMPLFVKEDSSE